MISLVKKGKKRDLPLLFWYVWTLPREEGGLG